MSEAVPSAERSPKAHVDSGHSPVEAPVIAKRNPEDEHAKEALNSKLGEHGKEHGHNEQGHGGGELGKKVDNAVGGAFAVGGGTGALMIEPGAAIASAYGGPLLGAKVALFGLKILAPFATLLRFVWLQDWIVDKSIELAGTKVPAGGKSGGHDDHGGGHH